MKNVEIYCDKGKEMKAILEFDLDKHEDKLAHNRAISATEGYLVIHQLDNYLRNKLKYAELNSSEETAISDIREELNRLLIDYNIDMGNLE